MKYLLDTHILLWWLSDPKKLSKKAQTLIHDRNQDIFVSSVSFWELVIKSGLGRIEIPRNLLKILADDSIEILPLFPEATLGVLDLPQIHKDPFDRMLIAQAKFHDMVLITRDESITEYPITLIKG